MVDLADLENHVRRRWGWHPDVDDIVQEAALVSLERPKAANLRHLAVDGARRVLGRSNRPDRPKRPPPAASYDDGRGAAQTMPLSLACYRKTRTDEDDENARQWREWQALSLRERQSRIIESHRALGSSGS